MSDRWVSLMALRDPGGHVVAVFANLDLDTEWAVAVDQRLTRLHNLLSEALATPVGYEHRNSWLRERLNACNLPGYWLSTMSGGMPEAEPDGLLGILRDVAGQSIAWERYGPYLRVSAEAAAERILVDYGRCPVITAHCTPTSAPVFDRSPGIA